MHTEKIDVVAVTDPEGANVEFDPPLEDGKMKFIYPPKYASDLVVNTKVTVGEGANKTEYNVRAIKMVNGLGVFGSKKVGVGTGTTQEEANKIMNHEENITLQISGPYADIVAASQSTSWTSFKINGVEYHPYPAPFQGYTSVGTAKIKLPARGETLDVKIEIDTNKIGENTTNKAKESFSFKIMRVDETVDVPYTKLIISDKDVIQGKNANFKKLRDGSKPEFEGGEPTTITVEVDDEVDSIKIDGKVTEIKTKKDEYEPEKTIWYATNTVEGVKPAGKDVEVIIEGKDKTTYHETTLSFTLKYKEPVVIVLGYEINGKDEYELEEDFVNGLTAGTNPTLNITGSYLNLKLTASTEIESVKINNDVLSADKITKIGSGSNQSFQVLHSIMLGNEDEQVDIEVTPVDKDTPKEVVENWLRK